MKHLVKKHHRMTKAELIRCIEKLEQRAPATGTVFEHGRLLHELQIHQVELETQNRELREAQLLLESSRDRYADLYDFAPVGYVTLDHKGIIRDINLTAAGMLGVERTRLIGVPFHLHVAENDIAALRRHLKNLSEDLVSTELRLYRKVGEPLSVAMQSVLAYDPEQKGFLCRSALTDITERKKAEQAARGSADLNQGILDSLSAHIAVLDNVGNIVAVNEAWKRFAKENGDDTLAHTGIGMNYLATCGHAGGVVNSDAQNVLGGIQSVLNGTLPNFVTEYSCDSPKEKRWFRMFVTPLRAGGHGVVISHLDISQRRHAELALSEQEARLRAVVDTAVDGIITIDERGTIESFNHAAEKLFGYSAAEAIGRNVSLLMPSPHREQHDRYLANYQASGERKIIGIGREVSGRRIDGSTFPMELSVNEVRLGARRIFTGIVRDITRRRHAEEALREQTERYRSLVEASPETIFVLKHGRIEYINPEGLRLFGAKSAGDVLGKSLLAFFPPGRHEVIRERMGSLSAIANVSPIIDEELVRLDGSTRWVTVRAAMFPEDGETAVQFILRDISERKQAEGALRASEERFRSIYTNVATGIAIADLAGRFVQCNPAFCQLTGYSEVELCAMNFRELIYPDELPRTQELIQRLHSDETPSFADEGRCLRKHGDPVWVSKFVSLLRDQHGRGTHVVVLAKDITERKRLQQELLDLSEREQRKFGHDLHDGLGQRLTSLEMFSHGLAEDLKRRAPDLAMHARRLNRELRETVTQARLISHSLAPVPLDGDGLMRGLKELASSISRLPGVKCCFHCDPPVSIEDATAATHLYRIAQEAVNNALKHGKAERVEISLTGSGEEVELRVENNGRPLPPKTKRAASGMGLNVMRYRAEMIGASLAIEPGKRKGARVVCTWRKMHDDKKTTTQRHGTGPR